MKIKTLVWKEYVEGIYFTQDDIPHFHYRIHQVDVGPIYGLFFAHGYISGEHGDILATSPDLDKLKDVAQDHWRDYVESNYLEE